MSNLVSLTNHRVWSITDPVISELEKALNDARKQKLNRTGDSEDDGSSSGSGKN